MEIKEGTISYLGHFPKTLEKPNAHELLRAVYSFPQDRSGTQRGILDEIIHNGVEAEILQRNPDYAIMRICPTGYQNISSHWLIGYADDNGLFMHNLPEGNLDYCSEAMWYILQWINRIEDGFIRVQGDLLLRDIKDGWEIERLEREEKEEPNFFRFNNYRMGNSHELYGAIATVDVTETIENDAPVATAKVSKEKSLEISHRTHRRVRRESKKTQHKEVALQRRGTALTEGDGD